MLKSEIRLALVNRHTLFREMLKNFFSQFENMNIVVEASDPTELINNLKNIPIDIALVDFSTSNTTLNETLKNIRNEYPRIRIIVLSENMDLYLINDLLDIGIHGYVSQADGLEELTQAIISVSEGRIYRNKILTEALYINKEHIIETYKDGHLVTFTEREKKILQLMWEEKSNKDIANVLFLGVRSIEKIRQDMKEKIAVKSTIGLMKYALRNKLINIQSYVTDFNDNHRHSSSQKSIW